MLKNSKSELIMKQRAAIDFYVHLGKSSMEMNDLIQHAYGMEAMTRSKVFKWCLEFREGQTMIGHTEGSSRP